MSIEKHFVFDDDGKLKEVRGYRNDIVSERWGIVYDESERVVGLRPLSVKEVIPQSILDRMKFWRKPKPLTQILSIDFIGLIQYIGLINKINKIKNIELIDEITTIKNIEHATVDTLTTIRDLTWSPRSLIQNIGFEQEFAGWIKEGTVDIDTSKVLVGGKSAKFSAGVGGRLYQKLPIPFKKEWLSELDVFALSDHTGVQGYVRIYYMDGNVSVTNIDIAVVDTWERKPITLTADKSAFIIEIWNNVLGEGNFWIDDIISVF